jgi:hypothetical protein
MHTSRSTCTSHPMDDVYCQFPFPSYTLSPFVHIMNHPLYSLGNPPLMLVVPMFVHTCPWLVINCPSPTPNPPPFLFLTVPNSSRYMFSKTTSQHQVYSLIQGKCQRCAGQGPYRTCNGQGDKEVRGPLGKWSHLGCWGRQGT